MNENTKNQNEISSCVEDNLNKKDSLDNLEEKLAFIEPEFAIRKFKNKLKVFISIITIAFIVTMFYINVFGTLPTQPFRGFFIAGVVLLSFLYYPAFRNIKNKDDIPWYDFVLSIVGLLSFLYIVFQFEAIALRNGNYNNMDVIVGGIGILVLFEACRRVAGIPILIVVITLIAYTYFGSYIPGPLGHRGFSIERIITHLFFTTEGIIGTPIGVASTFIFLFILFGAFIKETGVAQFFIDLANAIAGKTTGGPAKVAVIASALQGTISGSSTANTVTSGSFTIPMMKRMGYKGEFAGGVEASASTGGQIMPPIMGAAAFLMAEIIGVPYSTILKAAIIPAILYFSGILIAIHLEARKYKLKVLSDDEIPNFFQLLFRRGYLLSPLVAIGTFLVIGMTASTAAYYAIAITILISLFNKSNRMTIGTFFKAIEEGGKSIIPVAVTCGVAGIVVGIVTLTGLGLKLANILLSISGGILVIGLFFTMITSIILGMGIPTTANYVIMASITAPIVVSLGAPVLAAHMFVFYFGVVADVTPPVALASFAASAIAKANPLRTAMSGLRLAIAAFIIPYIFVLNPSLLLIDTTLVDVLFISLTALIGMFAICVGLSGYFIKEVSKIEQLLFLVAGLSLMNHNLYTYIIGFSLMSILCVWHIKQSRAII